MRVLVAIVVFVISMAVVLFVRYRFERRRKKRARRDREVWSIGVYEGATPFDLAPASGVNNPVLTAEEVHDVRARFVADPFMLTLDGLHHLFFEVLNIDRQTGEIGHATSEDLCNWHYQSIVLREKFHLSYPYVFFEDGVVYMVPECGESGGITLYRADRFPDRWVRVATLIQGKGRYAPLYDSSLVKHRGRWYLFSYARKVNRLHLFSSENLTGSWREHPKSPLISGSPHYARPGGRVIEHDGVLFRFAQDGIPNYGSKVWAFRINELSEGEYAEELLPEKPVVMAGDEYWNDKGMHTVDLHRQGGSWIAMVDGLSFAGE
ncbi:MAG: glycoside hydrolase family 32 protein [Chlorobiaceae bacterium]|nr:glycoside hydrolase family 32 protein [Chlorobiaceae bacterium]